MGFETATKKIDSIASVIMAELHKTQQNYYKGKKV